MLIQTKCCNLSEKVGIDQTVKIWVQRSQSKYCNLSVKVGIDQNIEFSVENVNKIFKFNRNSRNQSKCWNLNAKCQINQSVAIWVK